MKSIINEIKYNTNSSTLLETINHTLQLLNGSVSCRLDCAIKNGTVSCG